MDISNVRVVIFNSRGDFYDADKNAFVVEKKDYKTSGATFFYLLAAKRLDKSARWVHFNDDNEVYCGDKIKIDLLNGNELRKVQETDSQNP